MISEIIQNRRSVYPDSYSKELITKNEINQILESANWAPTHKRTEPWRFKVFHTEEARQNLSEFLGRAYAKSVSQVSDFKQKKMEQKALQSGCVIAICMQRDPQERIPEWEEVAATAMAVQNMWLTAYDLHIGAYWSSPGLIKFFHEYVPLNEGEKCLGFFYMGKMHGEVPQGNRNSSIEEKTRWF
ncbi:nitroreductase [Jejudonia soesokkakensis]|uniref:Putative NAD(P)H nitroreductase n=1 Tax=Jejudonia soesokkakensis TaxID=1323432 RepID=A0ABW2MQ12_9FLAO